jgi:uroporphyrinogen decarboxylase
MDLPNGDWQDEFGVVRRKTPSSKTYDLHRSPLSGQIDIEDVEAFAWPDPDDPGYRRGLNEKARFLYQHTDRALVGYLLYNIIHMAQYLRGFDNWFMDFAENPALSHALHKRCADLTIEVARHFLEAVGEYVQLVMFSDDIAGQQGLMISPQAFRDIIKPQWKRLFACIRQHTKAKLALHCCGNITPILDDIVELGVDVINPVQLAAKNMDSAFLKGKYGDKLSFWGGIDTQHVLPYGSPENVTNEVRRRIEDLATGGGYLLAASHTIQPDVSPENICAMFDTERSLR